MKKVKNKPDYLNYSNIRLFFLLISLLAAFWLLQNNFLALLEDQAWSFKLIASFISGLFYTSLFTAPVAAIAFYMLGEQSNPLYIAIAGGLGAMISDLIINKLIRNVMVGLSSVAHINIYHRINKVLRQYNLNFIAVFFGSIIVASPFPDELGLILLGFSEMKLRRLIILSFVLNTLGILAIVWFANSMIVK